MYTLYVVYSGHIIRYTTIVGKIRNFNPLCWHFTPFFLFLFIVCSWYGCDLCTELRVDMICSLNYIMYIYIGVGPWLGIEHAG